MSKIRHETTKSKLMWTAMTVLPAVGLALGGLAGCAADQQTEQAQDMDSIPDGSYIALYAQDAIDNAIVREHAVYMHHFRPNAAELNTIGMRVIETLAQHYGEYGGPLSVVQGDANEEIFEARIAAVRDALADAGVEPNRITIGDMAPGGDGIRSEAVLRILDLGAGASNGQELKIPPTE